MTDLVKEALLERVRFALGNYAMSAWVRELLTDLASRVEALEAAQQWRPIEEMPVSPEALHLRKWFLIALRTRPYQSQKWCIGFCELDDDGARRYVNDMGHTIDFALNKEEAIAYKPLTLPQENRSNDRRTNQTHG